MKPGSYVRVGEHTEHVQCIVAAFIFPRMGLIMGFVLAVQPKDAPMPHARLLQVLKFTCAGAVLVLPILGERFIDREMTFVLIVALYAASAWMTWVIWREATSSCEPCCAMPPLRRTTYGIGSCDLCDGRTAGPDSRRYHDGSDRPPAEE